MAIDYSAYLFVDDNGEITWRLNDAIKLTAGFTPNTNGELRPTKDAASQNYKTIHDAIHGAILGARMNPEGTSLLALIPLACIEVVRSDGGESLVSARAFLSWFAEWHAQTHSEIGFPIELVNAVRTACVDAPVAPTSPSTFRGLAADLMPYYQAKLADLPIIPRTRLTQTLVPLWDLLNAEQREKLVEQWDYQHDPKIAADRSASFERYCELQELREEERRWLDAKTPTAGDLAIQLDRLAGIRLRIKELNAVTEQTSVDSEQESAPKEATQQGRDPATGRRKIQLIYRERINRVLNEIRGRGCELKLVHERGPYVGRVNRNALKQHISNEVAKTAGAGAGPASSTVEDHLKVREAEGLNLSIWLTQKLSDKR